MKFIFPLCALVIVGFGIVSCNDKITNEAIDTSYLNGLTGDYQIFCSYNYYDDTSSVQIDTNYVGQITQANEAFLKVEMFDGTERKLYFTKDHMIYPECQVQAGQLIPYNAAGNWSVNDQLPQINFYYDSYICPSGVSSPYEAYNISASKL